MIVVILLIQLKKMISGTRYLFAIAIMVSITVNAQSDLKTSWHDLPEKLQQIIDSESSFPTKIRSANNETLWLLTGNDLYNFYFDSIYFNLSLDKSLQIQDFLVQENGNLLIGTNKGLLIWDQSETPALNEAIPDITVTEMVGDRNGFVYISGVEYGNGQTRNSFLLVFQATTGKVIQKILLKPNQHSITNLKIDAQNRFWGIIKATSDSLVVLNNNQLIPLRSFPVSKAFNKLVGFDFDTKNNLWLAGKTGLARFDAISWKTFDLDSLVFRGALGTALNPTEENEVTSICLDKNNVVWLGTAKSGILSINATGVVNWYTSENSPINAYSVTKIDLDHLNRKWFFLENKSDVNNAYGHSIRHQNLISYLEPLEESMFNWYATITNVKNPILPYYSLMQKDDAGNIWLLNPSYGLIKTDGTDFTTYPFRHFSPIKSAISCIALGKEVFLGSHFDGIYTLESGLLDPVSSLKSGLDKKTITHLAIDEEGSLWAAHLKGIMKCKNGNCKNFNKRNGLLSNSVTSVFGDSKGDVWIATSKGVSRYSKGFWTFYDKKHSDLQYSVIQFLEDQEGKIWAVTLEGVYYLKEEEWKKLHDKAGNFKWLNITCATIDSSNTIWLGTSKGELIQIDSSHNWSQLKHSKSQLNQTISAIVAKHNELWVLFSNSNKDFNELVPADMAGDEPILMTNSNLLIIPLAK